MELSLKIVSAYNFKRENHRMRLQAAVNGELDAGAFLHAGKVVHL